MLASLVSGLLLVSGTIFGLAWPLASRLRLAPREQAATSVLLSLIGVWLVGWIVYVFSLPAQLFWTLPVLAALGLATGARSLVRLGRDPAVRELAAAQCLVTGWCLGWLLLVRNYSGGLWAFDWFEHWERTLFFLGHWPHDASFLNLYALTARPPLTNVVTGVFLRVTRTDFAHFQLVMTLLGSLAFLPAALLAHRLGGRRAMAILAVLVMLNPLFVQNCAYPWTKLSTACFVLLALYFFLRTHDASPPPAAPTLCGVSLAAGLLAHYSAGPYAVLLSAGWLIMGRTKTRRAGFWRTTGLAALTGGTLLATWFVWAVAVYGPATTFLGNTTVSDAAPTLAGQAGRILLNLRDTVVPHFLRPADFRLLAQASAWSWWRDWFFQLYQLNLLFAFGCIGWLGLLGALAREARSESVRTRTWLLAVTACVVLGVGVHGARDTWGLVQICLQPLVLLGLAFLAARWPGPGSVWRWLLGVGLAVDLIAGIALNFFLQGWLLDSWVAPPTAATLLLRHTRTAAANLQLKLQQHLEFLGDIFTPWPVLMLALLGALLTLAIIRAIHAHAQDHDCHPDIQ